MEKNPVIIAIEDAITALDVQSIVRYAGYENTLVCFSREDAYKKINSLKPILTIVDIGYENQDDWLRLLKQIKRKGAFPVIALTCSSHESVHSEIKNAGAVSILTKPIEKEILVVELFSALS